MPGIGKFINEALEKAKVEGIDEGIEQVALNMIKENMKIETIMQLTGFNEEQLKVLKEQINK